MMHRYLLIIVSIYSVVFNHVNRIRSSSVDSITANECWNELSQLMDSCCQDFNSPTRLFDAVHNCTKNMIFSVNQRTVSDGISLMNACPNQPNDKFKLRIVMVTFATENILHYAAYSIAINAIYSLVHGHVFDIVKPSEHVEYQSTFDPRWNKVHIVRERLHPNITTGNYDDADYIVWLDSDLAIIDLTFSINELIDKYPYAEVIMSKDIATAPFVSNSGFMIVRCSLWSYSFFDLWWNSYDRNRCCDQNAFTWLYDRRVPSDIAERVVLLKVDTVNTNFPAWKNQLSHNPVLHLAGLSSLYRRPVFEHGLQTLCTHQTSVVNYATNIQDNFRRSGCVVVQQTHEDEERQLYNEKDVSSSSSMMYQVPQQIGLTSEFLFLMMRQLNHRRLAALQTLYESLPNATVTNVNLSIIVLSSQSFIDDSVVRQYCLVPYQYVQHVRYQLEDIMKFDDDERNYDDDHVIVSLTMLRRKELLIREWIFMQLHEFSVLQLTNINSHCPANDHLDAILSDDLHDEERLRCIANIFEAAKEAISTGFELVITMKIVHNLQYKEAISIGNSNGKRDGGVGDDHATSRLTRNIQSILNLVEVLITMILNHAWLPKHLQGMFYYYRFKRHQLMAGSYQLGSNISYNKQASIEQLMLASYAWTNMTSFNYFGTNYVLADPEKELTIVLSELAMLQCMTKQYQNGLITYLRSISIQADTIAGYRRIRIATEDVITAAVLVLAESYINAAICSIQYGNDTVQNALAKQYFTEAVDLLQSRGIDNQAMMSLVASHLDEINHHPQLLLPDDDEGIQPSVDHPIDHHDDDYTTDNSNASSNGPVLDTTHQSKQRSHSNESVTDSYRRRRRRIKFLKRQKS